MICQNKCVIYEFCTIVPANRFNVVLPETPVILKNKIIKYYEILSH